MAADASSMPLLAGDEEKETQFGVGPWRWSRPRLRRDWNSSTGPPSTVTGKVTAEESLWVVIVTMSIAGMRDDVLADHDLVWYILHFFVVWRVLSSSIFYSGRFNDYDAFHSVMWAAFLLCLLFMVSCLYHSLQCFVIAASCAHLCIAVAYARVACSVKRARFYCSYHGLASALNAAVLFLTFVDERPILWVNIFYEDVVHLLFLCMCRFSRNGGVEIDVPGDFEYMIARYKGIHMMIIVCSFLFPLGLQGKAFVDDRECAAVVVLGFSYALAFKLSFFDTHDYSAAHRPASVRTREFWIHPLKKSRVTSGLFLTLFPVSCLGLAVTGVGYVAAVQDSSTFPTRALSLGPTLTWVALVLAQSLGNSTTEAESAAKGARGVSALKVVVALLFAIPQLLKLSPIKAALWATSWQIFVLVLHIFIARRHSSRFEEGEEEESEEDPAPFYLAWRKPRLLKDWSSVQMKIGARVSTHEHFFTVLVAVAVFSLNRHFVEASDVPLYSAQFFALWAVLIMTMRYAARFNDNDASHALLWSVFELILLLVLEGLSANPGRGCFRAGTLFQSSVFAIFLWLAFGFWFRVALRLPRARDFARAHILVATGLAGLSVAAGFFRERLRLALLVTFTLVALLTDAGLVTYMRLFAVAETTFDVPLNIEYVVARLDGLYMEVLGVALIVPNSFYPGDFEHSTVVALGVLSAGLLAVLVKMLLFDSDATTHDKHAIRRSKLTAVTFLTIYPLGLLAISFLGGSLAVLVPAAGNKQSESIPVVPLAVFFGSASSLFAILTATKLLHAPNDATTHNFKAKLTGFGAVATGLPAVFSLRVARSRETSGFLSLLPIFYVLIVCTSVVFGQLSANASHFKYTERRRLDDEIARLSSSPSFNDDSNNASDEGSVVETKDDLKVEDVAR